MTNVYRITFAAPALAELRKIALYIALDSPEAAARTAKRILEAIDALADFPERNIVLNQPKSGLPPIRSLPVGNYVVFFEVLKDQKIVRILRIRHGARRPLKKWR
jgi:toxin ParE1/3/4